MSAQPVTADVGIGTIEGEIVDTLRDGDFSTGPEDIYRSTPAGARTESWRGT